MNRFLDSGLLHGHFPRKDLGLQLEANIIIKSEVPRYERTPAQFPTQTIPALHIPGAETGRAPQRSILLLQGVPARPGVRSRHAGRTTVFRPGRFGPARGRRGLPARVFQVGGTSAPTEAKA